MRACKEEDVGALRSGRMETQRIGEVGVLLYLCWGLNRQGYFSHSGLLAILAKLGPFCLTIHRLLLRIFSTPKVECPSNEAAYLQDVAELPSNSEVSPVCTSNTETRLQGAAAGLVLVEVPAAGSQLTGCQFHFS